MKTVVFSGLVPGDLDKAKSKLDHLLCITGMVKAEREREEIRKIKEHQKHLVICIVRRFGLDQNKVKLSPFSLIGNSGRS